MNTKIKALKNADEEMYEYRLEAIATKVLAGICIANGRNYSTSEEPTEENIQHERIMARDAVRMALFLMEAVQDVLEDDSEKTTT